MIRGIKISVIAIAVFLLAALKSSGQYIPTHISNTGIYEFMDELATLQFIDINSAIKPYPRSFIIEKLKDAEEKSDLLNPRQRKELQFYLKDYKIYSCDGDAKPLQSQSYLTWINKPEDQRVDLFSHKDSTFNIIVNTIIGTNLWANQNGVFYHWWNGLDAFASVGNFALFASFRDNHESTQLTHRDYMNPRTGGANIKNLSGGKRDYWEVRGGLTYEWNWGHLGLLMDQFSWGDANNGTNILSGRTPAFPRIDLQLNPASWIEFNYVHAWLVSEVVDSTLSFWVNNSYGSDYREVFHPKYLAANMFTVKPLKNLYISAGNSIIYDFRHVHPAFLIPVIPFWKALDHTLNSGINNMNSQLFLNISSRNLKGFHFFASAFIDEVQVGRIFREGEYNFSSFKIGAESYILPNTFIQAEYTWSNALVFRHYVPTTTFESNQYNLGHFLEDNAEDLYIALGYKPIRTLSLKAYYNFSRKGPDHTTLGTLPRTTIPPLEPNVWTSMIVGVKGTFQVINDLYVRVGYEFRNVDGDPLWMDIWTPVVYQGKTGTIQLGINYGF